jgi:hypothetical protein
MPDVDPRLYTTVTHEEMDCPVRPQRFGMLLVIMGTAPEAPSLEACPFPTSAARITGGLLGCGPVPTMLRQRPLNLR